VVFDLNEGNFGIRKISGSKNGRQCLRKNQKEKSIHKYKNKSIFTEDKSLFYTLPCGKISSWTT